MKKSRAEAFSDGVFAVAATLLVFNLVDPKVSRGLGTALLNEWPSYAAYVISFSTIVVIWVNHHGIIDAIGRFDRVLLFLNGLLLLTVAAIPFPTGLLAHYLEAGHDQTSATVAYGLTMSSMSLAFSIFNLYARRYRIKMVPLDWVGFSLGLFLWPLATVTAFFSVTLALALYAFVVLFYVALPITRERRAMAASGDGGALGLSHGDSAAAKARGGDLSEDS
ncbi:MAG TPA: TMEM175 family protein [Candidatus Dormibacteraeota bacterium]|nr:TMEM175 family protein [Candidatus Dormibacteraeota bacterium]